MSRSNIFKSGQQSSNKNSRFNFVDEELKLEQSKKINETRQGGNNLFLRQTKNTVTQSKPVTEQSKPPDDLNSFPALGVGAKEKDLVAFPVLGIGKASVTDVKIQESNPTINNSYSKAIKHENVIIVVEQDKDEVRRNSVNPGWVHIFKNKSGKTEVVHGPKTDDEKLKDYQDSSMNYQMYLAITRMEERWKLEKQRYDAKHGENAYDDSYGYTPTYDSDCDDNSDSDSDYETDYDYE